MESLGSCCSGVIDPLLQAFSGLQDGLPEALLGPSSRARDRNVLWRGTPHKDRGEAIAIFFVADQQSNSILDGRRLVSVESLCSQDSFAIGSIEAGAGCWVLS